MEQYCKTLDITYIDRETKRNKKIIKEVLKGVKLSDIPKDKKHIYYIMYTYFYPSKIESHSNSYFHSSGIESHSNITVSNFCNYFSMYILTEEQIKHLFFTIYNKIVLLGLKPDLSNISVEYLEKLFLVADEIYFSKLLNKFLKDNNSVLIFELKKLYGEFAGLTSGIEPLYTIAIDSELHIKYFKYISIQKANGVICRNPLLCLLSTFLHELVHLILRAFCMYEQMYNNHPALFRIISRSLFGHTSYEHSLGPRSIVGISKYELMNRKYVSFYQGGNFKYLLAITDIDMDLSIVKGIVIKGNDELERGEYVEVGFNIIYKKEPTNEDNILLTTGINKDKIKVGQNVSFFGNKKPPFRSNDTFFYRGKIREILYNNKVSVRITEGPKNREDSLMLIPISILHKEIIV